MFLKVIFIAVLVGLMIFGYIKIFGREQFGYREQGNESAENKNLKDENSDIIIFKNNTKEDAGNAEGVEGENTGDLIWDAEEENKKEEDLELASAKADKWVLSFNRERIKRGIFQYETQEEIKESKARTSF